MAGYAQRCCICPPSSIPKPLIEPHIKCFWEYLNTFHLAHCQMCLSADLINRKLCFPDSRTGLPCISFSNNNLISKATLLTVNKRRFRISAENRVFVVVNIKCCYHALQIDYVVPLLRLSPVVTPTRQQSSLTIFSQFPVLSC